MDKRVLTVGAAQMGPVARDESKESAVARMVALMRQAAARSCDLVVFPELALTTFFPRWFIEDQAELDRHYEFTMPSAQTQPLFDAARFVIGASDVERQTMLVDGEGLEFRVHRQPGEVKGILQRTALGDAVAD